jgi:hypothetical protein
VVARSGLRFRVVDARIGDDPAGCAFHWVLRLEKSVPHSSGLAWSAPCDQLGGDGSSAAAPTNKGASKIGGIADHAAVVDREDAQQAQGDAKIASIRRPQA